MSFYLYEKHLSKPRLGSYFAACSRNHNLGNEAKEKLAMELYLTNIKLSQCMYAVLHLFEVVLRNKIDSHYSHTFQTPTWLVDSVVGTGFLTSHRTEKTRDIIVKEIDKISIRHTNCTNDKLIASLTFGVWKFMFADKEFAAGGSTLHQIMPMYPTPIGKTNPVAIANALRLAIYKDLDELNSLRNRISHLEPICFAPTGGIDGSYVTNKYNLMIRLLGFMAVEHGILLDGIDTFSQVLSDLNLLKQKV